MPNHGISENNTLGYSGTNAGGHLIIEDTIFRHNSVGIAPSSLTHDDPPPPQDGACDSGSNTSPLPTFSSTYVSHCTFFRNNTVVNDDNLNAPAYSTTAGAPWGVGIEWPGLYGYRISNSTVKGHPNFGILAFEAPNLVPDGFHHAVLPAVGQQVLRQHAVGQRHAARRRRHRPRGRRVRNPAVGQQLLQRQPILHGHPGQPGDDLGLPEPDDPQRRGRPGEQDPWP